MTAGLWFVLASAALTLLIRLILGIVTQFGLSNQGLIICCEDESDNRRKKDKVFGIEEYSLFYEFQSKIIIHVFELFAFIGCIVGIISSSGSNDDCNEYTKDVIEGHRNRFIFTLCAFFVMIVIDCMKFKYDTQLTCAQLCKGCCDDSLEGQPLSKILPIKLRKNNQVSIPSAGNNQTVCRTVTSEYDSDGYAKTKVINGPSAGNNQTVCRTVTPEYDSDGYALTKVTN